MWEYLALKNAGIQFLEITGVPVVEFDHYIPPFQASYIELYAPEKPLSGPLRLHRAGMGWRGRLAQIEDKLLFIWMYHQVHTEPSDLSLRFGLSDSQTRRWIRRLLPVFHLAREKLTTLALPPHDVRFLQLLNSNQVEYLIIGGYAVAIHGYLRPILDLDVFIATNPNNAQKMVQVLQAFGETVSQAVDFFQMEERVIRVGNPPFNVERFTPDDRFIQLGTGPAQFEVMTSISAVTYAECYPKRITAVLSGVPVSVIGLEHLKRNKQASIRLKDADDFEHLCQA